MEAPSQFILFSSYKSRDSGNPQLIGYMGLFFCFIINIIFKDAYLMRNSYCFMLVLWSATKDVFVRNRKQKKYSKLNLKNYDTKSEFPQVLLVISTVPFFTAVFIPYIFFIWFAGRDFLMKLAVSTYVLLYLYIISYMFYVNIKNKYYFTQCTHLF